MDVDSEKDEKSESYSRYSSEPPSEFGTVAAGDVETGLGFARVEYC